jgi:hypothetical protein
MLDSEQDEGEQEDVDDEGNIETKVQQGTGMISSVFPQAAINENIVSQQDEDEEEEENHKKERMKKMNKAAAAAAAAPGKILKGDTRGRKSPSSSPASRRTTPQKINLVAEGHAIVLPQVQPHVVDGFTAESLSGRTTTEVENLMTTPGEGFQSSSKKSKKKSSKAAGNSSDDELTSRAIRACLAAEAVMAALREECVLLHHAAAAAATVSEDYKNPVTEGGGNGTEAAAGFFRMKKGHSVGKLSGSAAAPPPNGQLSLQLQLAACENLSLAATAAFRELITSRLGFNMPAAHPSQFASTLHEEGLTKIPQMKHRRKPSKKPNLLKPPQLNLLHQPSYCASCSPSNSKGRHHQSPGQPQGLRAGQTQYMEKQYMNRGKFSMSIDGGKFSKPFEEPSCGGPCVPGPFSCSHPPMTVMSMQQQQHSCYSGMLLEQVNPSSTTTRGA